MLNIILAFLSTVLIFVPFMSKSYAEPPLSDYFFSHNSCYGRVYTPDHLAKQPYQQVSEIALSHFTYRQELLGAPSAFMPYPDTGRLSALLSFRVKGMETVMAGDQMISITGNAICEPEGKRLLCSLEGDGGRFYLEAARDKWRLRIRLASELYFETPFGFYALDPEPQDNVFLLGPIPGSHCQTPPRP